MPVHPTAIIDPEARLGANVSVGPYAVIGPGVQLDDGVQVGPHAVIEGPTVLGPRVVVGPHAVLGGPPQDKKFQGGDTRLVVGADTVFREFTTANRGTEHGGGETRIGQRGLFMAYSHVAHDCQVGDDCVFANSVALAGHVQVGDGAILGGLVAVHQHCRIGCVSMLGGGAMVAQDVPPYVIAQGDRARLLGLNVVGIRRSGCSAEQLHALKIAYAALFRGGRLPRKAAAELTADTPQVQALVDFLLAPSSRGICRGSSAP